MENVIDEQELEALLESMTFEEGGRRKLRCADAFKLNAKHNVPLKKICRVCNKKGIRICQCQLGCFG